MLVYVGQLPSQQADLSPPATALPPPPFHPTTTIIYRYALKSNPPPAPPMYAVPTHLDNVQVSPRRRFIHGELRAASLRSVLVQERHDLRVSQRPKQTHTHTYRIWQRTTHAIFFLLSPSTDMNFVATQWVSTQYQISISLLLFILMLQVDSSRSGEKKSRCVVPDRIEDIILSPTEPTKSLAVLDSSDARTALLVTPVS